MSTASQPIYNRSATPRPKITEVARKLIALRSITSVTGVSTSRTMGTLIDQLSIDELVQLGELFLRSGEPEASNK